MNAPFAPLVSRTEQLRDPASCGRLVSLIIPVHDEEAAIPAFLRETAGCIDGLSHEGVAFEFIFVNDGSSDRSLDVLIEAQRLDPRIRIIDLSRNFGKEAAMTAGLDACNADAAIPIDVDLQDPPSVIPLMIDRWLEGFEVVLAKRADRSSDSYMKHKSASWFYRIHNMIASQKIPPDVGDFRLLDRQVIEALKRLPERRRFMKGLFAWVGFRTSTLEYVREARSAGQSRFTPWRLWNLALEGITSFSSVPLEIWTYLGAGISLLSFLYGFGIVTKTLIFGIDIPGYASIITSILFLGGVQLLGIGVIGQYLGRVYAEIKQRPIYIVRKTYEAVGG